MSEENDDIKLAHDIYVESNKINVDELPNELVAKYNAIDKMIEDYDADQNEDKSPDAIVKASSDLKGDIEAWHTAKKPEPVPAPEQPKAATPEPAPIVTNTPPAPAEEEEDDSWSFTKYLK